MNYKLYADCAASRFKCCKKLGNGGFNFRCPYCGDSQKSSTKARAYFFARMASMLSNATTVARETL